MSVVVGKMGIVTADRDESVPGRRKPGLERPPMPKPLAVALDLLKPKGCALEHLDLEDLDFLASLDAPLSAESLLLLAQLNTHHRSFPHRELSDHVRDTLLERAHIVDWPEIRAMPPQMHWELGELDRVFHHWTNVTILCTTCHRLYDHESKPLPQELVRRARTKVLSTDTGRRALELFIERTLAMRDGRNDIHSPAAASALFELRKLHPGGSEPISVMPWPKQMRLFRSHVDPVAGQINLSFPDGGPHEPFMTYKITDVPPPPVTHPRPR